MMTERLYYTDSYSTYFDATITQVTQVDGRSAVALDRTFFYPTSGGQPHDVGTLNAWRVTDVIAGADGEILHVLDQPVESAAVGHLVQGEIDWDRRYDHMQQHAGQHLLSQSCFQLLGYDTLSVHFGATESTLDLDTDSLSTADVAELERFANTMV
ncbi:MAG: alanyl-tRNA editing protein, partial [Caldilineaceae bacterium]|nr:alanyl-tRNA editing protein [Caldilineaceae bacterium]